MTILTPDERNAIAGHSFSSMEPLQSHLLRQAASLRLSHEDRCALQFLIDNQVANEGDLYTLRGDVEYTISDDGFFKEARFGTRWTSTLAASFSEGWMRVVNTEAVTLLDDDLVVDTSRLKALGFQPRHPSFAAGCT